MTQFNETPCQIWLKLNGISGAVSDGYISTPQDNTPLEQTHLSSTDLILQYIADQVEKNPDTQIFVTTPNGKKEFIINDKGLIIPKE